MSENKWPKMEWRDNDDYKTPAARLEYTSVKFEDDNTPVSGLEHVPVKLEYGADEPLLPNLPDRNSQALEELAKAKNDVEAADKAVAEDLKRLNKSHERATNARLRLKWAEQHLESPQEHNEQTIAQPQFHPPHQLVSNGYPTLSSKSFLTYLSPMLPRTSMRRKEPARQQTKPGASDLQSAQRGSLRLKTNGTVRYADWLTVGSQKKGSGREGAFATTKKATLQGRVRNWIQFQEASGDLNHDSWRSVDLQFTSLLDGSLGRFWMYQ